MKKVAGRLRLDLAQYRELEAFAQFGSDLDKLRRSVSWRVVRVLVEMLKQPQYAADGKVDRTRSPMIYAVTNGYLDDIEVDRGACLVTRGFHEAMSAKHQDVLDGIRTGERQLIRRDWSNELVGAIEAHNAAFDNAEHEARRTPPVR